MKEVLLLGSTGSIGISTLEVIREHCELFKVSGISANTNVELLLKQAEEFKPAVVVIRDENAAGEFRSKYSGDAQVFEGDAGLLEVTKNLQYDIFLNALVGFAGLAPTIEAIKRRKRIALANKETLVVAGELINKLVEDYEPELLPVDSEHSAIFQCLTGENSNEIQKLVLTASGGPFRHSSFQDLQSVTVQDALNHPNWDMGNKITIDSATMMNKGLEVIEAHWLFRLPKEKIEVVIHPQSIVHSMVEFIDGSIKAQMSVPDMKLPIVYALSYPERLPNSFTETNFTKIRELTFFEPDFRKFECLKLAFDVMDTGGTAPCILNAANEIAVSRFLRKEISFLDIPRIINKSLDKIENKSNPDLETIFDCDRITREISTTF